MLTLRKSTLIAALLAAAPLTHAGSDFEWIKRQLAISEGSADYAQPAAEPAGRSANRTESRTGDSGFDFYQRQLQLSDGAAPYDGDAETARADAPRDR